jgi:hypothetical protein
MNVKGLENKLDAIEAYIPSFEKTDLKTSKASVGWQLDHSLKVINAVIPAMQKSDKSKYSDTFTFVGKILLFLQVFPRGKAKAPSHLVATSTILEKDLTHQLDKARKNVALFTQLDENAYFKHPMFGNVNKKRALTFLNTHTKHHLKIVRRILK